MTEEADAVTPEEDRPFDPAADLPAYREGMDWFVLRVASNKENSVRETLLRKVQIEEKESWVGRIMVPTEKSQTLQNGKRRVVETKLYPGYVFVEMKLFDTQGNLLKNPWYKVKETDGVINFIGRENPTPLGDEEIGRILKQVDDAKGKEVPKVKFGKGEVVKILDGPFLNLTGEIEDIDAERGTLKVSVSIFGRFTPVELEFWQVEKADEE